jgi:glycosyltransferase involved in cell wall biosynthesis
LECEDYFICLGNISRRKNQLSLLRVANEAGIPIVFVGALTNDEDSLQFQAEIKHSNCCKYIGHVDNCSTKMTSIVSSSRGLILMSESETQPIAVLEFLVASKPVILRNRAYVEQFRRLGNCIIVNELNRDSLVKAIESISSTILQENAHILREFKADSVGQQYLNIYRGCFS